MNYRGEDLDIRTPQTRGGSSLTVTEQRSSRGGGPIYVDETVLTCCNYAYEVALAHRSSEVRLEHLLHALTRVDAAAQILESRGIRELALRRETAAFIAADIPIGLGNGQSGPRRSEDFELVLRRASEIAGGREAPASVKDVLHVMMDLEPGLRGLELLRRHLAPPQPYMPEPRYANYEMPREQMRMVPAYYVNEPPPRMVEPRQSATDNVQNSRLDTLEQMVRGLTQDLAQEREGFSTLLQSLQSDVRAGRDGIDRVSGSLQGASGISADDLERKTESLNERLANFERSLETRFDIVEAALQGAGGEVADLTPLAQRLDNMERIIVSRGGSDDDALSDKIATRLRGIVGDGNGSGEAIGSQVRTMLAPVSKKMDDLQQALDVRQGSAVSALNALSDRVGALERTLSTTDFGSSGDGNAAEGLSEVHDALMKLNENQLTLADAVNKWRGDTELRVTKMGTTIERLHKVTVERYHRRNRLWYWLFGTDDWIAASWPSQAARVEEELKAFQCGYRDEPPPVETERA